MNTLPPFKFESAVQKMRMAEDGWNSCDAAKFSTAYTLDTQWWNQTHFLTKRDEVEKIFLKNVCAKTNIDWSKNFRTTVNRIALRYAYECHDDGGSNFRSYWNENLEFVEDGLIQNRHSRIMISQSVKKTINLVCNLGVVPMTEVSLSDLNL